MTFAGLSPACRSWGSGDPGALGSHSRARIPHLVPSSCRLLLAWLLGAQSASSASMIGSKATPQDLQIPASLRLKSFLKAPLIDLLQALP